MFGTYSLHFQPFIVRYGFSSEIISSWNCHAALLVSIILELVFWKPIIIISYKSYCDHTLHTHTYDLRPTSLVETNRAKPNKYMTIIIIILIPLCSLFFRYVSISRCTCPIRYDVGQCLLFFTLSLALEFEIFLRFISAALF